MKAAFHEWTKNYVSLEKGEQVSGDGKALKSTVKNYSSNAQDFEGVVSFFAHQSGLVYALENYKNKKVSEINVVHFLLNRLKNMGVTIHLDALHCQKK